VIYGAVAFGGFTSRPAPYFVAVPPISWLFTAIVVLIGTLFARSPR